MTTMPHLYDDKDVMEEFISCYRHFTPLWDSSSMAYLSKKKKAAGYQQLLKILRRVNPEASIQDVKRKINSLRCCYRREIKKIQASYDSYEPRLWWFHMMDFIKPVLNLNLIATTPPTPTPTSSRIKHERQSLDDSLDEASMHVSMRERERTRDRARMIHMIYIYICRGLLFGVRVACWTTCAV
ncbi:GH12132 [Drosophila grimshawi]|uniref:GH12132 n=1 Tax=Drosophila grimshawi TaxID=7222 RepID=B4JK17_DROGR|nr:GH12132 [Drosophila grimshawi]